jgi:hypothetical protein
MSYVHAILPNNGLGNMLFPWARAEIYAHTHRLPMLRPNWFKMRVGPYLRREVDKREYWRLFRGTGYVGGVRKLTVLWSRRRVAEPVEWYLDPSSSRPPQGTVVIFEGLKATGPDADYFRALTGHRRLLRTRLVEISRPSTLAHVPTAQAPFVAIHVRRGDMAAAICRPDDPTYVPPLWYFEMARAFRQVPAFARLPIRVFTDGGGPGLDELRALPDVEFVDYGNAVANILAASEAVALIGTGYSTFSRWISFIGDVPTVFHPASAPLPLHEVGGSFEGGCLPTEPLPEKFVADVNSRLAGRRVVAG